MQIKPRFGSGLNRRQSGGDAISRLQQMAGGAFGPGRSPKEERRSRSPRESHRTTQSSSSMRRSRSRERNEKRRSRERSPPEAPQRRASNDYIQQSPPPSRSHHRGSRSRSRSPPMRERDGGERYSQNIGRSGHDRPRSPVDMMFSDGRGGHASSLDIKQEPVRHERIPEISPRRYSPDHHRSPTSISPSPPIRDQVPQFSWNREQESVRSRPRSPEEVQYNERHRERPRSPGRMKYSDSKSDRRHHDRR